MRAFAGIPVPAPARDELGRFLADLRRRDWPVKWVQPDGLHITVHFFGEVPPEITESLGQAMDRAGQGQAPIPLAGAEFGAFPDPQRARVLWFGLEPAGELELLVHRVEQELSALGFEGEGRPFHPHITLGRVRRDGRLPRDAWSAVPAAPEIAFAADRLVLYESRTAPGGAMYTVRYTTPLAS